jgi:hypothetical protein
MKIIKISQEFQMIPQNPGAQNDPNVQLQNLQNAQLALDYFRTLVEDTNQVMAALRQLEDDLGLGDIGLRTQVQQMIAQSAMGTPAFNLLAQMNFISSIENLMDENQIRNVEIGIDKNIQSIQSGQAQMTQQTFQSGPSENQ